MHVLGARHARQRRLALLLPRWHIATLLLAYLDGRRLGEGKGAIEQPGRGDVPQFGDEVELLAGRFLARIQPGQELIQELDLGGAEHGQFVVFQPASRADRARGAQAGIRPANSAARVRGVKDGRSAAGIRDLAQELDDRQPGVGDEYAEPGLVVTTTSPGSVR